MDRFKHAGRTLLSLAALALLATPALAGHKYRDVLVVPSAAPVVYAAPTVYAAPVTTTVVQSAPTVVVERTRVIESAPVVVQSAPAVVATPVPTAYVVPRRAFRPLLRPRTVVAVPAAPVVVSGW